MKGRIIFPEAPPKRMMPSTTMGYMHAVEHICRNMRPDEQLQHMLVFGADPSQEEYNPRAAAIGVINISGVSFFYVDDNNEPMCAGGYQMDPVVPGLWHSWMIGTPVAWERYWRDLTKGTRWLMGQLLQGGARRLETTVLASRGHASTWFTDFLGITYEGSRRRYFGNGEDMLMYSYTDEDYVKHLTPEEAE